MSPDNISTATTTIGNTAKIAVVAVWVRCHSAAYSRYVIEGAALVHRVCATTAVATQKLARRPSIRTITLSLARTGTARHVGRTARDIETATRDWSRGRG